MTLEQALNASNYNSAIAEYNSLYTAVNGSLFDGYDINTGEQGYPVRESQHVETEQEAIEVIKEMHLDNLNWEPFEEAEA